MLKNSFVLLLTTLLLLGSLGVSHIGMDAGGHLADCPFTIGVSICTMNPFEIIAASQSLLNSTTLQQDPAILLILLIGTLIVSSFPFSLSPPSIRGWYRIPKQISEIRSSFLQEAFSDGILNPKLF